jgi:hypothetical protein
VTIFSQWLPAIAKTPAIRKGVLTAAGLAFVGGAIAGPLAATAQAAPASPAPAMTTVAQVSSDKNSGNSDQSNGNSGQNNGNSNNNSGSSDKNNGNSNQNNGNSDKQLNVNYQTQPNYYYCAPAATQIALSAGGHNLSQDDLANQLGTTVNGTNSAEDTTRVLNSVLGSNVYKTTSIPGQTATPDQVNQLQADVKNAVDNNRAVVANIAGTATDTDGATHSYEGGHYLTVVGYRNDGTQVQISDPASPDKPSYWMNTADMANWIATRGYSS